MALEKNYACLGITCEDVGGIIDTSTGNYYPNAEPCIDGRTPIAGYRPVSQYVANQAATLDSDQTAFELELARRSRDGFVDAERIYKLGGYSKPYAILNLDTNLPVDVAKGAFVQGLNQDDANLVRGQFMANAPAGSSKMEFLYDDENYKSCIVGGLQLHDQTTVGCLSDRGTIVIYGVGPMEYTYSPTVNNYNALTLKSLSTSNRIRMLDCPHGCTNPTFEKYLHYYGVPDYSDQWVTAALGGVPTQFDNGNADFSSPEGGSIDVRIGKRIITTHHEAVSLAQLYSTQLNTSSLHVVSLHSSNYLSPHLVR